MRYLGIDWGKAKIGVALGDDETGFAFPRKIVRGERALRQLFAQTLREEKIGGVVVGIPRSQDGETREEARRIAAAAAKLAGDFHLAVFYEDERMTTKAARRLLSSAGSTKKKDDAAAAALILQSFLDRLKKNV